jgi:hypothetical protein
MDNSGELAKMNTIVLRDDPRFHRSNATLTSTIPLRPLLCARLQVRERCTQGEVAGAKQLRCAHQSSLRV